MRKTVPYLAGWFVAGMAAVGLASLGVSVVSRQVIGNRPAPLSADQVRDELASAGPEGDAGATTTAPPESTTTAPSSTSTTLPGGPTTEVSPPSTATPPPSDAPSTTVTAAPPPPAAASTTRTYDLAGGTATIRFSPDDVAVVVATPKAGFSVEVSESHDGGARVEFRNDDQRSRVDAWWDGGPQDEVDEDADGS